MIDQWVNASALSYVTFCCIWEGIMHFMRNCSRSIHWNLWRLKFSSVRNIKAKPIVACTCYKREGLLYWARRQNIVLVVEAMSWPEGFCGIRHILLIGINGAFYILRNFSVPFDTLLKAMNFLFVSSISVWLQLVLFSFGITLPCLRNVGGHLHNLFSRSGVIVSE